MNNNKQNPIVVGVGLIIASPLSAFCGAAAFALFFGLPFTVLFYSIAGVEIVLGVMSVAGGIKQILDKRKANSNLIYER
jgi:hypothetical protein